MVAMLVVGTELRSMSTACANVYLARGNIVGRVAHRRPFVAKHLLSRREPFGIIALTLAPKRGPYDSGSVRCDPDRWWWQAGTVLPFVELSRTRNSIRRCLRQQRTACQGSRKPLCIQLSFHLSPYGRSTHKGGYIIANPPLRPNSFHAPCPRPMDRALS